MTQYVVVQSLAELFKRERMEKNTKKPGEKS
jgi:hypothetical protein